MTPMQQCGQSAVGEGKEGSGVAGCRCSDGAKRAAVVMKTYRVHHSRISHRLAWKTHAQQQQQSGGKLLIIMLL